MKILRLLSIDLLLVFKKSSLNGPPLFARPLTTLGFSDSGISQTESSLFIGPVHRGTTWAHRFERLDVPLRE